ncbi:GNAT family N-acetyltransferase [Kitasatospora sp. MAP5-34]|uniref:GNAT family N-acetyltransferase n=1 Tax=Kitasatospora sp. MAP5-34 TaxID=3035102 RepID=UPI0024745881|nr:GNAT family N-acetyltransferase [Kitasatospora sp. MAP5-34]MDH6577354.1 GNAT superfamily N-acetyltransferase [Kitasatospora sp. MAP5-34]
MTLTFALHPPLDLGLREEFIRLWTDASNAGGAVGFVPPVTVDQARAAAEKHFAGLGPGCPDRLLIAREVGSGRLAGMLIFEDMRFPLMDHWRLLKLVMVHPDLQGRGYGAELMGEAERIARGWGLSALRLTLRGGLGLEKFYGRCGYTEVGRVPAALRVAPGDDRDEVTMWLDLR